MTTEPDPPYHGPTVPKAILPRVFHPAAGAAPRLRIPLTQPLRHARYRRIWLANLVSNLGTWIQTFAAVWLVASLSQSASIAALVQTATYAPVFLFALLTGVLADAVHRPKFLCRQRVLGPGGRCLGRARRPGGGRRLRGAQCAGANGR
ncbi:MFS transporter [Telluria beijingensis]|uniref:MFS transporter n=1 Tax=Telluria beijingensis TaxID=3068633 RepID=UPI002795DDA4|nr:MFS transporter [Massilia sp. REN29]